MDRLLGVDLTDPEVGADPAIAAYAGPAYEILSEGIFSEAFGAQQQDVFAAMTGEHHQPEPTSPHEGKA